MKLTKSQEKALIEIGLQTVIDRLIIKTAPKTVAAVITKSTAEPKGKKKGRPKGSKMTKAARKKISDAMKRRWAEKGK